MDSHDMHLHVQCCMDRMIVCCEELLKVHLYNYIYTIMFKNYCMEFKGAKFYKTVVCVFNVVVVSW